MNDKMTSLTHNTEDYSYIKRRNSINNSNSISGVSIEVVGVYGGPCKYFSDDKYYHPYGEIVARCYHVTTNDVNDITDDAEIAVRRLVILNPISDKYNYGSQLHTYLSESKFRRNEDWFSLKISDIDGIGRRGNPFRTFGTREVASTLTEKLKKRMGLKTIHLKEKIKNLEQKLSKKQDEVNKLSLKLSSIREDTEKAAVTQYKKSLKKELFDFSKCVQRKPKTISEFKKVNIKESIEDVKFRTPKIFSLLDDLVQSNYSRRKENIKSRRKKTLSVFWIILCLVSIANIQASYFRLLISFCLRTLGATWSGITFVARLIRFSSSSKSTQENLKKQVREDFKKRNSNCRFTRFFVYDNLGWYFKMHREYLNTLTTMVFFTTARILRGGLDAMWLFFRREVNESQFEIDQDARYVIEIEGRMYLDTVNDIEKTKRFPLSDNDNFIIDEQKVGYRSDNEYWNFKWCVEAEKILKIDENSTVYIFSVVCGDQQTVAICRNFFFRGYFNNFFFIHGEWHNKRNLIVVIFRFDNSFLLKFINEEFLGLRHIDNDVKNFNECFLLVQIFTKSCIAVFSEELNKLSGSEKAKMKKFEKKISKNERLLKLWHLYRVCLALFCLHSRVRKGILCLDLWKYFISYYLVFKRGLYMNLLFQSILLYEYLSSDAKKIYKDNVSAKFKHKKLGWDLYIEKLHKVIKGSPIKIDKDSLGIYVPMIIEMIKMRHNVEEQNYKYRGNKIETEKKINFKYGEVIEEISEYLKDEFFGGNIEEKIVLSDEEKSIGKLDNKLFKEFNKYKRTKEYLKRKIKEFGPKVEKLSNGEANLDFKKELQKLKIVEEQRLEKKRKEGEEGEEDDLIGNADDYLMVGGEGSDDLYDDDSDDEDWTPGNVQNMDTGED